MKLYEVKMRFDCGDYIYIVVASCAFEARAYVLTNEWRPGTTEIKEFKYIRAVEIDTSKVGIIGIRKTRGAI